MFKHLLIWAVKRFGEREEPNWLLPTGWWKLRLVLPRVGHITVTYDEPSGLEWSTVSYIKGLVISDKDFSASIGIRWPWNQGGGLGVGVSHDQIRGLRLYTWTLWLATSRSPVQVAFCMDDGIPF